MWTGKKLASQCATVSQMKKTMNVLLVSLSTTEQAQAYVRARELETRLGGASGSPMQRFSLSPRVRAFFFFSVLIWTIALVLLTFLELFTFLFSVKPASDFTSGSHCLWPNLNVISIPTWLVNPLRGPRSNQHLISPHNV